MTMGSDFQFTSAAVWYKNLDKLIKYVNARQQNGSNVNVFYSTPSCYLHSLHTANLTWPTKTDDFFPYASNNHSYWTGYFTSRPALKGYVRQTNNFMQAVKQLASFLGFGQDPRLERLKEAMGVLQHHDAVSGTAKQAVTNDYAERLAQGVTESFEMVAETYSKLLPMVPEVEATINPIFCPNLNESSCPPSEKSSAFTVALYNPLGKARKQYPVRIPVPKDAGYTVTDLQGNSVVSQLVPIPENLAKLPGRNSTAEFDLVFLAHEIPPLGFIEYHVQKTNNYRIRKRQMSHVKTPVMDEDFVLNVQERIVLAFDKQTNLLVELGVQKEGGFDLKKVNQTYLWYAGMSGDNSKEEKRASGAYIFRPNGTAPSPIANVVNISFVQGEVVTEIHQTWSPWMSQVLRIYSQDRLNIEMEWLVGSIPIEDGIGKEIINRLVWGDVSTDKIFYTDANGREILKRVKDHRDTWELHNYEPVAGNYYPVNSRLIINTDKGFSAALLNDRSQGGTSLDDGHMELMIHRRLLHDDAFGVGEALNETAFGQGLVVRGKHYLLFSDLASTVCDFGCLQRSLSEEIMLQPVLSFIPTSQDEREWRSTHNTKWSGMNGSLPENVHLLTLEPWLDGSLLLRLEHMYEKEESQGLSDPVTVDLKGLFSGFDIETAVETNLAANQLKKNENRYVWDVGSSHPSMNSINSLREERIHPILQYPEGDLKITLNPMEIRTFILNVKKS
ncbi:carbohydrate binding [Halocaridina rubra]|uniref:Alpha-mannosidase n=1 Tax=Halocaridina rubra TaxID=373956 RepID=A0AAN8X0X0_HALRR